MRVDNTFRFLLEVGFGISPDLKSFPSEKFDRVASQATAAIRQSPEKLAENFFKVTKAVKETTGEGMGAVGEISKKAEDTLVGATRQVLEHGERMKEQTADAIAVTAAQAKSSVGTLANNTDFLVDRTMKAMFAPIVNSFHHWQTSHPFISFLFSFIFSHPLVGLLLLALLASLLVYLFQNLSRSIGRWNTIFWDAIFSIPLKIGGYLFNILRQKISPPTRATVEVIASADRQIAGRNGAIAGELPTAESADAPLQFIRVLHKLEELNRQQNELLREISCNFQTDNRSAIDL